MTIWDAAGCRDEKRSPGGHKTPHIKKRSHEDTGTNSHDQQPQYHAKTGDGAGFISHNTSLLNILTVFQTNMKIFLHCQVAKANET